MFPIQILLGGVPLNMTEAVVCLAASVVITVAFNAIFTEWDKRTRVL